MDQFSRRQNNLCKAELISRKVLTGSAATVKPLNPWAAAADPAGLAPSTPQPLWTLTEKHDWSSRSLCCGISVMVRREMSDGRREECPGMCHHLSALLQLIIHSPEGHCGGLFSVSPPTPRGDALPRDAQQGAAVGLVCITSTLPPAPRCFEQRVAIIYSIRRTDLIMLCG